RTETQARGPPSRAPQTPLAGLPSASPAAPHFDPPSRSATIPNAGANGKPSPNPGAYRRAGCSPPCAGALSARRCPAPRPVGRVRGGRAAGPAGPARRGGRLHAVSVPGQRGAHDAERHHRALPLDRGPLLRARLLRDRVAAPPRGPRLLARGTALVEGPQASG